MNCPLTGKPIPNGFTIVHPDVWFKIPAQERAALAKLARMNNQSGVQAKLAKIKKQMEIEQ